MAVWGHAAVFMFRIHYTSPAQRLVFMGATMVSGEEASIDALLDGGVADAAFARYGLH